MTPLMQHLLERHRNGALATGGQAGEPNGTALLLEYRLSFVTSDVSVVPGDIRCYLFGHGAAPS